MDGANRDAGVDVAVERDHAHRAAIPAAGVLFQILDGLRGPFLRRADDGHGPHVGQERIERIEAFGERAFDVIDGVEQARVRFDQPPADHAHRAGLADARFVVAVDVACTWSARTLPWSELSSSRMLSASRSGSPVRRAVPAMGQVSTRRPSTRTNISGDAPISCSSPNCRRNSYGLGLACWIRSNSSEAAAGVGRAERLPQHHFVVIAAAHAFAHRFDLRHVLFGRVVGGDRGRGSTFFGRGTRSAVRARPWVVMSPRAKSYWKRSICSFLRSMK